MDKQKEIKIDKMVLSVEGEKISLTIEQAKKLHKVLDELFAKEIVKEYVHDWYYRQPLLQPTIPTPGYPMWWNTVTCQASTLEVKC